MQATPNYLNNTQINIQMSMARWLIFYKISKQTIQVLAKAEFSRAEKFKKTVSKPVLEALGATFSTKVNNATDVRNFFVKVIIINSILIYKII